jgi:hypothetical protein
MPIHPLTRASVTTLTVATLTVALGTALGLAPEAFAKGKKTRAMPETVKGFATPESVLYDKKTDTYYVSNINGVPDGQDDNGFVTKLNGQGVITDTKWLDGDKGSYKLNAPKGSAIVDGQFWVADIDHVRVFDLADGRHLASIAIKGTTFLNDVTPAGGKKGGVYVTDTGVKVGEKGFEPTGADAIYHVGKDFTATTVLRGAELGQPNGIIVDGKRLIVAGMASGELYTVNLDKKTGTGTKGAVLAKPAGFLDGLVKVKKGYVVSSWEKSAVYLVTPKGEVTEIAKDLAAPADIGFDPKHKRIAVPHFNDNTVEFIPAP